LFADRLDLDAVRREHIAMPELPRGAQVMTDDFSPVEFLDAVKSNNTGTR
jgi:spermidine synthase